MRNTTDTTELLAEINGVSEEMLKDGSFDVIKNLQTLAAKRKLATDAKLIQHESRKNL